MIFLIVALLATASMCGACRVDDTGFSESAARGHVDMLAGRIGSRPIGTQANAAARAYIVEQLTAAGYDVRVQLTDAERSEFGLTARVSNIIAVKGGEHASAIGLVAHYDSSPDAPGATDDGLGVAVCLEAARVLGQRTSRKYSLVVLLTDGEEAGLMGAAAAIKDEVLFDRVRVYLNFDSIGSAGPSMLFQTGPGNKWAVRGWARGTPQPRGSSYAVEIYRRLPAVDTDFTILQQTGVPGLNFAPVRDSYAYHTARDTSDRLSSFTLRQTGATAVATVLALEERDMSVRTATEAVFFDVASWWAFSYGATAARVMAIVACIAGFIAWILTLRTSARRHGVLRLILSALWTTIGAGLAIATMIGAAWLLRASREVFHPWYARPGYFLAYLTCSGLCVIWLALRLAGRLPQSRRTAADPNFVWIVTWPVWMVLVILAEVEYPLASYLWSLPLLMSATIWTIRRESIVSSRIAAATVLAVVTALWLRETNELARFLVTVFGRLPVVTPVYCYPLVLSVGGLMLMPPLLALLTPRPLHIVKPWLVTSSLLLGVAISTALAYTADAYTFEEPLRRSARFIHDAVTGRAWWTVGGNEPGLDLEPSALQWRMDSSPLPTSVRVRTNTSPFEFRAEGSLDPGGVPAKVTATLRTSGDFVWFEVTVVPKIAGSAVTLVLPEAVRPWRSNLAGVPQERGSGSWTSTYLGPPPEGVTFRVMLALREAELLPAARVAITIPGLPGGEGWQRLPRWLPQERVVWHATSSYIAPVLLGERLPGTFQPIVPPPDSVAR